MCGKRRWRASLNSTHAIDSPDLDTRPSMPMRADILWMENCPRCGYCAPDLSEGSPQAARIVATGPYREQLYNPDFPDLANAFLCYSLIAEQDHDFAAAGWACLYAAWVCDDDGAVAAAPRCRRRAVDFFELARHRRQEFAASAELEKALIVDLLRRSGDLLRALVVCQDILTGEVRGLDATLLSMLRFQEALILRRDTETHLISEAIEYGNGAKM